MNSRILHILALGLLPGFLLSCSSKEPRKDVPVVKETPSMLAFAREFSKVASEWEKGDSLADSFTIAVEDNVLDKAGMLDVALETLLLLDEGVSISEEIRSFNKCLYPDEPKEENKLYSSETIPYKSLLSIARTQHNHRIQYNSFASSVSLEGEDFSCERLLVTLSRFYKFLVDHGIFSQVPSRMAEESISCKFVEPQPVFSEHPRLFCNAEGFANLAKRLQTDRTPFYSFHQIVMGYAEDAINKESLPQYSSVTHILQIGSAPALRQLTSLGYAFRITGEKKYLNKAEEILKTVCAFPEWNASNAALAMGEMGLAVATAYDWLYDDLKEETKELVRKKLYELVLLPHINAYKSGSFVSGYVNLDYLHFVGNWNQVCTCGVGVAALVLSEQYPTECDKIIKECAESVKTYAAKNFGTNGNYCEGPSYWGYGTGMQCIFSMALSSYLGEDYGVGTIPCLLNTPRYILFLESTSTGKLFDYSDSGEGMMASPMFFFARRDKKPEYLYHEVTKVVGYGQAAAKYEGRFLPILFLGARELDLGNIPQPEGNVYIGDGWQPMGVFRYGWDGKPTNSFLGVKAGTEFGNHAQMDVGSFVYDAGGVRWSSDPGNVTYSLYETAAAQMGGAPTGAAQNSIRWWVNCYNNKHHSTLSIADDNGNAYFHNVGSNAAQASIAAITSLEGESGYGGIVDMTMSKNLSDYMSSVKRSFLLKEDGSLLIVDELKVRNKDCNVQWRMLTSAIPTVYTNSISLVSSNKQLKVQTQVSGCDSPVYSTFPILHESYPFNGKSHDNTWDTSYLNDYKIVGFTCRVAANSTVVFKTRLTLK